MLDVKNVTKKYKTGKGIFDFTYTFEEGKVYALVGPNGAGKTTLIKMLVGISEFQKGYIQLDGISTKSRECKKNIGYALDFYPNEYNRNTILQFLSMYCEIKYHNHYREDIQNILKDYELLDVANTAIEDCSLGMKKKVGLIASFIGNPQLIVLDEPTNGIDTTGLITLKNKIIEAKQRKSIVIVSSHILDFVDAVSDEVLFLKKGRMIPGEHGNTEKQYRELFMENTHC
ncbi:MAG: ABC transporter ATP-binding protein [Lachnospira sp.]